MKISLTWVFIVIFLVKVHAQNDYRKAWSKDTLLTWADFKGPIDESSEFKAFTRYRVNYTYKWTLIEGKYNFTFNVTNNFVGDQSWTKPDSQTPELLRHEQIHFDISEFFARKLFFALNNFNYTGAFVNEIADMSGSFDNMRNDMEALYDDDTRHGLHKKKQLAWDNYVTNLLSQDPTLEEALNTIPGKRK